MDLINKSKVQNSAALIEMSVSYTVDYVERKTDGSRSFGFHTVDVTAGFSPILEDWVYELVLSAFISNKTLVITYAGLEDPANIISVKVEA